MEAEIEANVLERTAQKIEVNSIEWGSNTTAKTATVKYVFGGMKKSLLIEGDLSSSVDCVKFLGKVIANEIIEPGYYSKK